MARRPPVVLGNLSDPPPRRPTPPAPPSSSSAAVHQSLFARLQRWLTRRLGHLKSFPIIYILIVNMMASALFAITTGATIAGPVAIRTFSFYTVFLILLAVSSFMSGIQLCYPLGGLLADVFYGRYRVIAGSVAILWCGIALSCFPFKALLFHSNVSNILSVPLALALLAFMIGFSGFQANIVQFALDQLLESPSEHLSIFLHWFVWSGTLGSFPILIVFISFACKGDDTYILDMLVCYMPEILLITLSVLLCIGYHKHSAFLLEPGAGNPYQTVYRVLRFTKKHSLPIFRSAITYAGEEEEPSRIDFGKAKYGGPFTTEQVEDVKTFLRIVALLFCIGPIFSLQVATDLTFPLFGIHMGANESFGTTCTAHWMFLQSGLLSQLLVIIFLPVYIWAAYLHCQCRLPAILTRLGLGMLFCVLSIVSILLIEIGGYSHALKNEATENITNCFFIAEVRNNDKYRFDQTFNLSPEILLVPNALNAIGPTVVYISVLEFISAQSPYTMKGLLVGVFFAIRGLFTLLGVLLLYPIVSSYNSRTISHIPLTCASIYYVLLVALGVATLLLYRIVVQRYRYRQRDEAPFNQIFVENYFEHHSPQGNQPLAQSAGESGSHSVAAGWQPPNR